MWVLCISLLATILVPTYSTQFSSWRGRQKRMVGVPVAETLFDVSLMQCQLACHTHGDCLSFNHHRSRVRCELFESTMCSSPGGRLSPTEDWDWYDVADPATQPHMRMWDHAFCRERGRCREDCLPVLDEDCATADDCQPRVIGGTACSGGTCKCDAGHWQFNTTVCVQKDEKVFTPGGHWLWKKIVNDPCSLFFQAIVDEDLRVILSETYTSNADRYELRIGAKGNTETDGERIKSGSPKEKFPKHRGTVLDPSNWRDYRVDWCDGDVSFRTVGESRVVSWQDPEPLSPVYVGFYTKNVGRFKFKKNMVDPWLADSASEHVYKLPRFTLLLRRRTEIDFTAVFETSGGNFVSYVASEGVDWSQTNRYEVVIGGWSGSRRSLIYRTANNRQSALAAVIADDLTSTTEFRKFRIHFNRTGYVGVYRGDETAPFLSATDPDPFTIRLDGPRAWHGYSPREFKLVQYDDTWSYEKGYRFNVDTNDLGM